MYRLYFIGDCINLLLDAFYHTVLLIIMFAGSHDEEQAAI